MNIIKRLTIFMRNINYLSKTILWDKEEENIVYLTNKILDDCKYEYNLYEDMKEELTVLSIDETLELLEKAPKSFVRTGDGEINLIKGMSQPFQDYNNDVAGAIESLLRNPPDNIYVGINKLYYMKLRDRYHSRWAYEFRKFNESICSKKAVYIDAGCTSCTIRYGEDVDVANYFSRWKELFRGKDIAIICGEGILDKLQFDIFEYANSKMMIFGPKRNSWSAREIIISKIKKEIQKDTLLVFILGMGGKAMIPILTEMGYMCWDVGHLAKYYNAYMTRYDWDDPKNVREFYAPD